MSELLLDFLEDKNSWEGKTSDLFAELTKIAEERNIKKEWPKSTSTFGKKLKRLSHNLEEVGVIIKDGRDGNARRISITKSKEANKKQDNLFFPKRENYSRISCHSCHLVI